MAEFRVGQRVRVSSRMPLGHIRTPAYLRGKTGTIERSLGPFGDPERLAYGQPADLLPLRRVRFSMADVWADTSTPSDTIDAEIYDTWLEAADDAP